MKEQDLLNLENQENTEEKIDYIAILNAVLEKWYWYVLSGIICLAIAVFYLLSATQYWGVESTILIKDKTKGGGLSDTAMLESLGVMNNVNNIDNEIIILGSRSLIAQTLIDTKQYVIYQQDNFFRDKELYRQSPIVADMEPYQLKTLGGAIQLRLEEEENGGWNVTYPSDSTDINKTAVIRIDSLPAVVHTVRGRIYLAKNKNQSVDLEGKDLLITIISPSIYAKNYRNAVNIMPASKTTSIANISLVTTHPRKGVDFVNKLIDEYNLDANKDKNQVAVKTENFIKERLNIISKELSESEDKLEEFKTKNGGMVSLGEGFAQTVYSEGSDFQKQSIENMTQISLIDYLEDYLRDPRNDKQLVPTNVGLQQSPLTGAINTYNQTLLEYDRLLQNSSKQNPVIKRLTNTIDGLKKSMFTTINSVRAGLKITQKDIDKQLDKFNTKIKEVPTKEHDMLELTRQQRIKNGLYLLLLQKMEQNSINIAAQADNAKTVDSAMATFYPVTPKKKIVLLIALFLAVLIPSAIIYVIHLLKYQIESIKDITDNSSLPTLGDIPSHKDFKEKRTNSIAVLEGENSMMAEAFRKIRTSLLFTLTPPDEKVIIVTSTTSGEGKTFISSNLAISLALQGKKVIAVGLDLRKPRLARSFNHNENVEGTSKFLIDPRTEINSLIIPIANVSNNLDIIPGGAIPPNPAELLTHDSLDKLIIELRKRYDYVILDCAPAALVSDTQIISRVADATVYVTRANVTSKNDLKFIEDLVRNKRLPNISLVLNGTDIKRKRYGYGYGYGNGYGYGYGYQSDKK